MEPEEENEDEFIDKVAFNEKLFTREYKHKGSHDILLVGKKYKTKIMNKLEDYMKNNNQLTFYMVYKCKLIKFNAEGIEEIKDVFFPIRNRRLLHMDDFENEYDDGINGINNQLGKYMGEGSGWQMDSITSVTLNIAKYNPIRGSSYIETPKRIENKKAVINVKNNDNRCFEYAILASIYPAGKNAERVGKYKKYLPTLNTKGI